MSRAYLLHAKEVKKEKFKPLPKEKPSLSLEEAAGDRQQKMKKTNIMHILIHQKKKKLEEVQ